ncbi:MAG: site-2 protease family protein [Terriglobales bacterium]
MNFDLVGILFQMIAFLFAISVHESAHAWTASRRGDPTARMLGRVSLNPIRHIDPIGTILLPVVAAVSGFTVLGWAKPTPVDPRNFRNPVLDDILTSVAGPVSNFIVASGALILLWIISRGSETGRALVHGADRRSGSILEPLVQLLVITMLINIVLAVFNLIPVPPLDGSHVIRHFMSDSVRRAYDGIGIFGLLALVYLGKPLLQALMNPFINFFFSMVDKF